MRDWEKLVNERLQKLALSPERNREIVAEIANHLEEHFEDEGRTENEILDRALSDIPAWETLRRGIQQIELQEGTMNYRTKTLWLPGLVTLTVSLAALTWARLAELEQKYFMVGDTFLFKFFNPWLFLLPILGLMGAYWSRLAGGRRREQVLAGLFASIALFGVVSAQSTQGHFADVTITTMHVRDNIYLLSGGIGGGNSGVSVGKNGIFIVNAKSDPEKLRAALKEIGEGELKYLVNTDWRAGFSGANRIFGPTRPIIAHTNVRKKLSSDIINPYNGMVLPKWPQAYPSLTFEKSFSVHINGEEVKIIHFPHGHTDGDSVVFFTKSNVVHIGDLFNPAHFPQVDLESGGSVEGMAKNIGEILQMIPEDTVIIPGHGKLSTVEDLKDYHRMLTVTTQTVRRQMKAGKSLDEIKAAGLPAEWNSWDWRFINKDRWIETIYRSLSREH